MNKQEHELMLMMFARTHEALAAVTETLKSRGIWTEDDEAAYSHAIHADDKKILRFVMQARADYLRMAKQLDIDTGLA